MGGRLKMGNYQCRPSDHGHVCSRGMVFDSVDVADPDKKRQIIERIPGVERVGQ